MPEFHGMPPCEHQIFMKKLYIKQTNGYKAYSLKIKETVKLVYIIHSGLYGLDFDKQKKTRSRSFILMFNGHQMNSSGSSIGQSRAYPLTTVL